MTPPSAAQAARLERRGEGESSTPRLRLLAVATDAGGAANVAPVAGLYPSRERRVFCSDAAARFFHDAGVSEAQRWPEGESADRVLAACRPDVVLCGTTRYASADRQFVAAARASGTPVVVVLDEWFRYIERFGDGAGAPPLFPNVVCVQDDLALGEAVAAGLPPERLVVTGSPALSALADRIERFAVAPPPLPAVLVDQPRPWIVFVSEPHAEACGSAPGAHGPWGSFMGFTEDTVAADLASVLAATGRPCTVIDKLHPVSPESTTPPPMLGEGQAWRRVARVPTDHLFWHADLVVGMRSAALLEAAMTGRPVLSYQPNLAPEYGPATCERFDLVESTGSRDRLADWLRAHWTPASTGTSRAATAATRPRAIGPAHARRARTGPPPVRPAFARAGAAGRVRDVLAALSRVASAAPSSSDPCAPDTVASVARVSSDPGDAGAARPRRSGTTT